MVLGPVAVAADVVVAANTDAVDFVVAVVIVAITVASDVIDVPAVVTTVGAVATAAIDID